MTAPPRSAPVASLIATGLDDAARARDLSRMKWRATGLLILAALIFLFCLYLGEDNGAWVGYLKATAEASMIGALADWFAVTALFRHPLGIPIPHTAIIPNKKDQIGASLGTFIQENFLTEPVLQDKIHSLDVPTRIGEWLGQPGQARKVGNSVGAAMAGISTVLRDEDIQPAISQMVERGLRETPAAPALAKVLTLAVEGGHHQTLLTAALRGLSRFLDENRIVLRNALGDESPEWVPDWLDDRVFQRGFKALQSFLDNVAKDDEHELRRALDVRLRAYISALKNDPATAARVEVIKEELLDHPAVRDWSGSLWQNIKSGLVDAGTDPNSELRQRLEASISHIGESLREDADLRAKVEGWIQTAIGYVVHNYAQDIADLISGTVARWDTDETSRRIELQVGRDLQFIRINGTVVGALAGLTIYTVSQILT
ncbi:MAG: DUF445 domain-containing protein [Actinomycetota bacterium]|nr:DUF445 domain-containing protein [Actinomycetota bacterium]